MTDPRKTAKRTTEAHIIVNKTPVKPEPVDMDVEVEVDDAHHLETILEENNENKDEDNQWFDALMEEASNQ